MRSFFCFSIIFGFVIAAGNACSESGNNGNTALSPGAPPKVDGKKIYQQYCLICHGVNGDMGASGAFDLTQSVLTVEERIEVITNGRNAMTPFNSLLNPHKIKAVAEYTLKLREGDRETGGRSELKMEN